MNCLRRTLQQQAQYVVKPSVTTAWTPATMAALQPCQVQQITPKSITRTVSAVRKSPHTVRSTSTTTVYEALLDWADVSGVDPRPVAVQQHSEYGRCLVATEDIPIGTVLLSVPLDQVFQSQVCLHPAPLMVFSLVLFHRDATSQTSTFRLVLDWLSSPLLAFYTAAICHQRLLMSWSFIGQQRWP